MHHTQKQASNAMFHVLIQIQKKNIDEDKLVNQRVFMIVSVHNEHVPVDEQETRLITPSVPNQSRIHTLTNMHPMPEPFS